MKILIIGQAPPAVTQTLPYDTTLLYDMLSWVGITKEQAQDLFEFEAMSTAFPGHGENGHLKPSSQVMREHYDNVLTGKIQNSKRILVLGRVAENALKDFGAFCSNKHENVVFMIHPSKRNYSAIMSNKETITIQLQELLSML